MEIVIFLSNAETLLSIISGIKLCENFTLHFTLLFYIQELWVFWGFFSLDVDFLHLMLVCFPGMTLVTGLQGSNT